MADVMCRGDVLLMKNGDVGVVRTMYKNQKYNICVVELKGQPQQIIGEIQQNNCIRIKLNKKSQKPKNKKQDFRKLSGEQLFDKLFVLHEIINKDQIHQNKLQQLQTKHETLLNKLKQKQSEIYDLRDTLQQHKKHLLLQQSIYTITHPKNIDKTSTPVLLLTYPTFTNSIELFENISNRFFHLNHDDYQQKLDDCQWEIQIKVISLIQCWIRTYWIDDFFFNVKLIDDVDAFKNKILSHYKDNDKYIKLSNMIQQSMDFQRTSETARDSRELIKKQTFTLLIEEIKSEFQELDNRQLAEQMTLIDFANFQRIKHRECLNQQWLDEEEKYELSPNICEMIASLNKTFKWCQVTILLSETVDKRGRLIKKFIKVCRQLLALNNFHSLAAVFGALRSTPIWRLKNAWKMVPNKHIAFYDELVVLFDTKSNMKNLRNAHKKARPPMVPYTGIFLSELVGIEEGNKSSTKKKAINFKKLVMIARSIETVLIFQKTSYDEIKQDVPLQHFLNNQIYDDLHQMRTIDEDYLYNVSKLTAKQDAEDHNQRQIVKIRTYSNSIIQKLFS